MMTKGKFGLSLAAIAVIAFGFAALRQPQSVLLVVGFALLAERDEWLNRQAMQALGRTVYTHEYRERERLIAEYEAIKSAEGCQSQQRPEMA